MRTMLMGLAALVTTGLATPRAVAAQHPQTREGFWIGFGVGSGTLNWECDACPSESHGGPTGFLRLGGTLSAKLRLGGEINGWSLDFGNTKITALVTVFSVDWYPSASGGFFLKGGVGGAAFSRQTAASEAVSSSGSVLLGVGYDIRVGRNVSITPVLNLWGSGAADLKDNGAVVETGLRHTAGTLQLGITFH